MNKIIALILVAISFLSCNKATFTFNTNKSYEIASREIENSSYRVNTGYDKIPDNIQTLPIKSSEGEEQTAIVKTTIKKKKNISIDRQLNDTIVQNEENYQRSNRIPNPNANTALVLGLVAFIPLPLVGILGLVAMGFGLKALNEMKLDPYKYKGKGKAIFGIAVGCLIIALFLAALIIISTGV